MTKKKGGKKGKRLSMFSALPPTLKRALRSQPRLESGVATTAVHRQEEQPTARLLPTQPPSEVDDPEAEAAGADTERESSDMDMDMDSDDGVAPGDLDSDSDGDDSDKENVRPASARPVESSSPSSNTGSAVISRRVETAPQEANADHPWDCTGLVLRYTDAGALPKELRKCELIFRRRANRRLVATALALPRVLALTVAVRRNGVVQRDARRDRGAHRRTLPRRRGAGRLLRAWWQCDRVRAHVRARHCHGQRSHAIEVGEAQCALPRCRGPDRVRALRLCAVGAHTCRVGACG